MNVDHSKTSACGMMSRYELKREGELGMKTLLYVIPADPLDR